MVFKLFGRTIQLRSPVKVYSKDEPILIETEGEFLNTFGKPNVMATETDISTKLRATETSTGFCIRGKEVR